VVCDNQNAHVRSTNFGDALAGQAHGIGVQPAIRLVEDRELRLQHRELQNLRPLRLAAGKTVVDISPGEFGVHLELLHF
jgi:hypothetical protein